MNPTYLELTESLGGKLSRAQRVCAAVMFDGEQPKDLRGDDRALARTLFGDIETVSRHVRRVCVAVLGRGSGKDHLGGFYGLWRMLTGDCSGVGLGDVATFVIVAPDMKLAAIAKKRAHALALSVPSIARLIEAETADGFTLRRPDGHVVALEVLAASRGGSAVRGRSILGALMSEAAFFRDAESVVNDVAIFSALIARLMRGGAILLFSTPWAKVGLLWDLYLANFGHPVTALVAQADSLTMRDYDPEIQELWDLELKRDPENHAQELGAKFLANVGGGNFFGAEVDASVTTAVPSRAPYVRDAVSSGGIDVGHVTDKASIVVIQSRIDEDTGVWLSWLAYAESLSPEKDQPLKPSEVAAFFVGVCKEYGVQELLADAHYFEAYKEYLDPHGIELRAAPAGQQGKFDVHTYARQLLREERLGISEGNTRLVQQLKLITAKPQPGGGMELSFPRGRFGMGHGDEASAFLLACWGVKSATETSWAHGLDRARRLGDSRHLQAEYYGPGRA